jgi:DNA polymerase-1
MVAGKAEGYWSEAEEATIILRLSRLLTHPNVQVIGQNILYDAQYTWRWWHFVPRVTQDTMIGQHAIFSDMPKGLGFLASMYCDWYVYWKDEGKDWAANMGEEQLWSYNCQDCVYTDEVGRAQVLAARKLGLEKVYAAQQAMFWPVLRAMQKGVRIDTARRNELVLEVQDEVAQREQFICDLLGHPLNPRSPKQMSALFYEDLKQQPIMTRATKNAPSRPTLNDEALLKIAAREPLLRPLVTAIQDIRTLGIFLSNFLLTPLDTDGRMRCAYNIGGSASGKSAPKTYRLSSSGNAFGSGGNLQNIPSQKSKSVGKAKSRGAIATLGDAYSFPNIRSMFVPDPGCTFWDGDLDRADLQVVAWEADDQMLKAALRLGVDIHLLNCYSLTGREEPSLEELCETHPRYQEHRGPRAELREFSKTFCHGTNYGGGSRTMAAHVGRTVHEVERSQRLWFGAHPGIKRWHERIELQVRNHHFVENRFGYRWYIFDRIEGILPEAIAWIPQSTVSIVINKIWANIYSALPEVDVLLQVHDSLCGQYPIGRDDLIGKIVEQSKITIPYEDPLVIPFSVKTSNTSWGDVH